MFVPLFTPLIKNEIMKDNSDDFDKTTIEFGPYGPIILFEPSKPLNINPESTVQVISISIGCNDPNIPNQMSLPLNQKSAKVNQ